METSHLMCTVRLKRVHFKIPGIGECKHRPIPTRWFVKKSPFDQWQHHQHHHVIHQTHPIRCYSVNQKSLHQNFIIKKRIYRTVLGRAGESVPSGHECSWPLDSPYNTFKDCSVYALLNNENFDVSSFDSHYRHLIGCVWCMTWWCWWCCHWSNGDFFTNHLVGIGLCLHSPIPGILKWTLLILLCTLNVMFPSIAWWYYPWCSLEMSAIWSKSVHTIVLSLSKAIYLRLM